MTELARELWRAVRGRASASEARPPVAAKPAEPIHMHVLIPAAIHDALAEALTTRLSRAVDGRATALGVDRGTGAKVSIEHGLDSCVEVSLSGRPLAVCPLAKIPDRHDEQWVDEVSDAVDRALLRRLSLLLDQPEAHRHAARISAQLGDDRSHLYDRVPGQVLDAGVSLATLGRLPGLEGVDECGTGPEIAELLIDAAAPAEILLEVAESILRDAPPDSAGLLPRVRQRIFDRTGLQFPDVTLVPTDGPRGSIRLTFNDVALPAQEVGGDAGWPEVVAALGRAVQTYAAWFVRVGDVAAFRDRLKAVIPDLVSLSRSAYSDPLLSACLRCLVGNGGSARNLARIQWLLLASDASVLEADLVRPAVASRFDPVIAGPDGVVDPVLVASALRRSIAEDAWQVGVTSSEPASVTLPKALERELLDSAVGPARAEAEWRVIRALRDLPPPYQVVTHMTAALAPVGSVVAALPVPPRVVASQELPPDIQLPSAL